MDGQEPDPYSISFIYKGTENLMKLHILSDIHLEFAPFKPPQNEAEVVVLAGDTHPGTRGVTWALVTFPNQQVIYVLGNHEYYGQALPRHLEKLREMAQGTNVQVLENESFIYGDVVFLGCTFWADFELFGNPRVAGYFATQSMNDYRRIRINPSYSRLRSIDTAGIHYHSRHWMAEQLKQYLGAKIVIVTHNAPSQRSLPEYYEDDILSAAYASDLDEFVENSGASLWIHGHVHTRRDYFIGQTRVICNPRGYPGKDNEFAPDLVVSV
jgi:predicted phosphodiesterase